MIRKPILKYIDYTNWATEIVKPITVRADYRLETDSVQYSRIATRVLGTGFDETDYLLELYAVSQAANVYVLSETLDKTMPPERFQSIQQIYTLIQEQPNLSINRFVAFLEGNYYRSMEKIPTLIDSCGQHLLRFLNCSKRIMRVDSIILNSDACFWM